MDIVGYVFLGIALISLIVGLAKGFMQTLLGFVAAVGSIAVAAIFTPTLVEAPFVSQLIEDAPINLGGQEVYFLRTLIVFLVLFLAALIFVLAIKGIFKSLLKRTKVIKFLDRLLGAALNLCLVWAIFGILFGIANIGTGWIQELEAQLSSGQLDIQLGLADVFGDLFNNITSSEILQGVYSAFNPIGDMIASLIV